MSHIVEAKTQIENPDQTLLRQAVGIVAQQQGGTVETFYLDYSDKRHSVRLALHTPDIHRGIGLMVRDGQLTFVGDDWGYKDLYQQIQQQIIQTYVSLATIHALQALGYQVTTADGEAGQVVISGVTYA